MTNLVLRIFIAISLSCLLRTDTAMANESLKITDKLMADQFSEKRPAGTKIDVIVLHFSSAVLTHPDDPFNVQHVIKAFEGPPKSSAHYLIDRDGSIYRLVNEERQAFHAGEGKLPWAPDRENKLNATSIGIEILAIGSKRDMTKHRLMSGSGYDEYFKRHPSITAGYTDKQYESLKKLIADVRLRNAAVLHDRKHIIGHEDYAPTRKTDPGDLFDWSKLDLPTTP